MNGRLLICTDLDRTLIPNGPHPEAEGARDRFAALARRPEVRLAYVTGRDRTLVQEAIAEFHLPDPDYVVGDVGSTIFEVGPDRAWKRLPFWEEAIAPDWGGCSHADLHERLRDLPELRLQERARQNRFKLSYCVPVEADRKGLERSIRRRLEEAGADVNLIWSIDDLAGVGLLDLLPARASKVHAVEALMDHCGFDDADTVFCGDSGNDLDVLISPIPAVLVANAREDVRAAACRQADGLGRSDRLYCARGGFLGMNGFYSAGILEGIAHYHPRTRTWISGESVGAGA